MVCMVTSSTLIMRAGMGGGGGGETEPRLHTARAVKPGPFSGRRFSGQSLARSQDYA